MIAESGLTPAEAERLMASAGYRPMVQPLPLLCAYYRLQPSTICNWAARGLIKRYRGGYDMLEVELRLQSRDVRRIRHAHRPEA